MLESGWYKAPLSYMIYSTYYCPPFVKMGHILNIANVLQGIVIFFVFGFKPSIRNHIKAKYQGRNLQSSASKTGSTWKTSTLSNASDVSHQNSTTRPSLTKLVSFSPSSEGPDVVFTESSDK